MVLWNGKKLLRIIIILFITNKSSLDSVLLVPSARVVLIGGGDLSIRLPGDASHANLNANAQHNYGEQKDGDWRKVKHRVVLEV
jgi:hypothetical protein